MRKHKLPPGNVLEQFEFVHYPGADDVVVVTIFLRIFISLFDVFKHRMELLLVQNDVEK